MSAVVHVSSLIPVIFSLLCSFFNFIFKKKKIKKKEKKRKERGTLKFTETD